MPTSLESLLAEAARVVILVRHGAYDPTTGSLTNEGAAIIRETAQAILRLVTAAAQQQGVGLKLCLQVSPSTSFIAEGMICQFAGSRTRDTARVIQEVSGFSGETVYSPLLAGLDLDQDQAYFLDLIERAQAESANPFVLFEENAQEAGVQRSLGVRSPEVMAADLHQFVAEFFGRQTEDGSFRVMVGVTHYDTIAPFCKRVMDRPRNAYVPVGNGAFALVVQTKGGERYLWWDGELYPYNQT